MDLIFQGFPSFFICDLKLLFYSKQNNIYKNVYRNFKSKGAIVREVHLG